MFNPALTLLCACCPRLANTDVEGGCLPSRWLTAGYVPAVFEDESSGWQRLAAHESIPSEYEGLDLTRETEALYRSPRARVLFAHLALTLAPFFPLSAREWELDLRGTLNPVTHLCLWETVASQVDYYTLGKKFSVRARREYLDTFWLFFHHGPAAAGYEGRTLRSLTIKRVQHVATELERFFGRRKRTATEEG